MTISSILLNAGYIIFVISPLFRNALISRLVLLSASIIFIIWSGMEGLWNNAAWNIAFTLMHLWQLVKIPKQSVATEVIQE